MACISLLEQASPPRQPPKSGRGLSANRAASLRFQTRSATRDADPLLELSRLGASEAVQLATDDDSGGGLEARIEAALNPGDCVVHLRDRQGVQAEINLVIERTAP